MADPNSMEIKSSTLFVVGEPSSPSVSATLADACSSSTLSEGAIERMLDDALSMTSEHVNAYVDVAPPLTAPTAEFKRLAAELAKLADEESDVFGFLERVAEIVTAELPCALAQLTTFERCANAAALLQPNPRVTSCSHPNRASFSRRRRPSRTTSPAAASQNL
jgi:hypothetical protein